MPKSEGRLKLFSFHIASLWRTTFDFGHSNHILISHVFSCWFFAYTKLKEELRCPWSSKSNRLVLIWIHPKWTPRKNKHWFVNCLLLLLRDYRVLAFIFMWQLRCTLNTCLKLWCPTQTHGCLVALNFNTTPNNLISHERGFFFQIWIVSMQTATPPIISMHADTWLSPNLAFQYHTSWLISHNSQMHGYDLDNGHMQLSFDLNIYMNTST